MKLFSLFIFTFLTFSANQISAQIVSSNAFLKGKYVEVGIDNTGAFGTDVNAPAGYHPRGGPFNGFSNYLGFVSDPAMDGWLVGSPDYIGDYFLPGGVPHEGYSIQVDGNWNRAWRSVPTMTGGFTATGGSTLLLSGTNTSIDTLFSEIIGNWQGTMGQLAITQKTVVDTNKLFFVVEVNLKNTGTTDLVNVYYERSVDPENEEEVPGGSSIQDRTVVYQPTGLPGDDDKCLVTAIGQNFPSYSYMGLGAVDCRAKAFILYSGNYSPNYRLDDLYDEVSSSVIYTEGATTTMNSGIGIVFDIGTIPAGDSTTIAYAYILKEAYLDSAFSVLQANWEIEGNNYKNGDTIVMCRGKDLEVNIGGGGAFVWGDWTPNYKLENPSGRHNIIHVDADMTTTTYTVIGTTTVCPTSDTMTLTIVPVGDTTLITKAMCAGEFYNFEGTYVYESGTYYKTYQTAIMGCDSVIQLNLTVNPLPDIRVEAREFVICDDEEALLRLSNPSSFATYQWYRNGVKIPGATNTEYVAPPVAGTYYVVGITDKGCIDTSRQITIKVNPSATANIIEADYSKICLGDTIRLEAEYIDGYEYRWSPEKYFRYTSGYRSNIVYGIIDDSESIIKVMAMNEYGCKAYDSVLVVAEPCCEALMPTVFTPNSDGINDWFNIKLLNHQLVVSFQIFNRRGNMVYDNNNQTKGWNGKINNTGEDAAQAVYFYRVVYTCTDGNNYELKGDVTLIR